MLAIWLVSSSSHPPSVEDFPFRDKGVHFLEYATLSALLAHAWLGTRPSWPLRLSFLVAAGSAVVFGLTDEIHQAYVPSRVASVGDLIADTLGALAGAALYLSFAKLRDKKRRVELS